MEQVSDLMDGFSSSSVPSAWKGLFAIPLTFTSQLAPNPFLVVYTMFPNGGIVADKFQFKVATCFKNRVRLMAGMAGPGMGSGRENRKERELAISAQGKYIHRTSA